MGCCYNEYKTCRLEIEIECSGDCDTETIWKGLYVVLKKEEKYEHYSNTSNGSILKKIICLIIKRVFLEI